jgi:hypothetical protein
VSPVELNEGKGRGGGRGAESNDRKKVWSSISRSILSAVNKPILAGQKDPEKPLYMGSQLNQFVGQGYMSGGSGYVLSRFVFSWLKLIKI